MTGQYPDISPEKLVQAGENRPVNWFCQNAASLGLDIGSTTIKAVLLNESGEVIYRRYLRHYSDARNTAIKMLEEIGSLTSFTSICLTGSGGLGLAAHMESVFLQEVLACQVAISKNVPDADVAIELGGEDAKVTFLTGGLEQRMNETCAGGTGAFIDQIAAFLHTDAAGLDLLAQNGSNLYPVASRCGVFAKSEILPLLNEGVSREDIASSIMQAVVNQTISGLAQGRQIRGKVVFLGGPLHFLKSLRKSFTSSLPDMTEAVFPEDGHFFVALGAALHGLSLNKVHLERTIALVRKQYFVPSSSYLPNLFNSEAEYEDFKKRHARVNVKHIPLEEARGEAWLGFDCGSTTLKAALIDKDANLLFSWYGPNKGDPLQMALNVLGHIYSAKHPDLLIRGSCSTGYGSALLKAALHLDMDEVETVAHFTAASHFVPKLSFIIDIGGQDIKCMHIKNGFIDQISLNEACSSGCGSFIENFADSLGLSLPTFVRKALFAQKPVDLGSRCTVFMNSKVRQAQKDGAAISDIAAGLAWSVVRNAIYKVVKLRSPLQLGNHVVAQGGAFLNDALLRALELELDAPVTRPAISGLMGAFGAALLAMKKNFSQNRLISPQEVDSFHIKTSTGRCSHCANSCLLTISTFPDKSHFISGNKCSRHIGNEVSNLPNLFDYKYKRLFEYYTPRTNAPLGKIGIPRALNIFENYPLWFTLFDHLGFSVELSCSSSREMLTPAFDTIPSQTVCYPAKLAHGHILDLVRRGIKNIFFPCVKEERMNGDFTAGLFNCPVVAGYPETLAHNMQILRDHNINYICPFLPLDKNVLPNQFKKIALFKNISLKKLRTAIDAAFEEMDKFRSDMRNAGENALAALNGAPAIVLAGHPYHVDPEIHHGIANLANSCGLGILTEDSIAHLAANKKSLRVVNQWAYHSRLYKAGFFVGSKNNIAVLQLISFGCGLDAVTSDQVEEILIAGKRLYAQIKIDEGANLGQARIRIRSLIAAMNEQGARSINADAGCTSTVKDFPVFTHAMRHTHKLLIPQMSPWHFQFGREIFASAGYDSELLSTVRPEAVEAGLGHVNNDACYPAILLIGQLVEAIKSGRYDTHKIALVISQTGGSCRATNYLAFLRKALTDSGYGHIPIANFSTAINAPGIPLTRGIAHRMIMAAHYGDALLRMLLRMRPYEIAKNSAEELAKMQSKKAAANIDSGSIREFHRNIFAMIRDFDNLRLITEERKPRVGLVGEILLKYHPFANNNVAHIVEDEGGEAVGTDIADFFMYCIYDHIFAANNLGGSAYTAFIAKIALAFMETTRLPLRAGFAQSRHFSPPAKFKKLRKEASKILSLGHQAGEGWLLAAEMCKMLESGISSILCMQPFGCLPNHIVGKGVIRKLKNIYPNASITALDYDPGTSEVNQINRIKLMMRNKESNI